MKITLQSPERTSRWIVEAHGYSGDADADNREEVYSGADEALAKRTYLEVLALAQAYPCGRGGSEEYSYTRLVKPLFSDRLDEEGYFIEAIERKAPFAWAAERWSRDLTMDQSLDATLRGADLFWIDEHGAKLSAKVEITPQERAILDGVWAADGLDPYPIEALLAKFLALDLRSEIPDPKRSKGPASL